MTILKVLTYPNPFLRKPTKLVSIEELQSSTFRSALADVEETLSTLDGAVALACNQVGLDYRAFVVSKRCSKHGTWFINPTVESYKPTCQTEEEGCLSFPGLYIEKQRMHGVTMNYMTLEGETQSVCVEGFFARVFQHEIDHLDGRLFIDHLDDNQKRRIALKMAKRGNGNVR